MICYSKAHSREMQGGDEGIASLTLQGRLQIFLEKRPRFASKRSDTSGSSFQKDDVP
jgi:hypothetical protein